ncbi:olfactory receptor 7E24-like, partial [Sigmodon hispidus]
DPDLQTVIIGLFLSMYILALFGNLLIILTVSSDSRLHTPMYFFICNLSIVDIGFISTTVPRVIVDIQTHCPVISYVGCLTQMSLFIIFGCMDNMLLAVMAYDRFVAICHPLYYQVIMNPSRCGVLLLGSFLFSIMELQLHHLAVLKFFTCENFIEIPSFFCGPSEVLELVHFDTATNNIVRYSNGTLFGLFPISGIIFSYYKIVSSIIRSPSSSGKHKTFSTCGSHLSIVGLFYGTGLGVYFSSSLSHSPRRNAVASVMYTVVTPMLNPFIYSLRNKDIKNLEFEKAKENLRVRTGKAENWEGRELGRQRTGKAEVNWEGRGHSLRWLLMISTDDPGLQTVLIGLFLSMYILALFGNLLIILTVSSDSHLHTPMYFFLSNLSIVDIGFISTTVPRVIVDIQTHCPVIPYVGCLTQMKMSLLIIFGCMDNMLLAVMAYDRFVAICHPLHYQIIMNPSRCVSGDWWIAYPQSKVLWLCCKQPFLIELNFYSLNVQEIHLSPSALPAFGFTVALFGIIFSYYKIVSSIIRLPSSSGKHKTFSTCESHLSIVGLFYGTGLGVYFSSSLSHSLRCNAVASVMYTVVTPMLIPFIYSVRNKDIKKFFNMLIVISRFQLFYGFKDPQKEQKCSRNVNIRNSTCIPEFHFIQLSENPDLQNVLIGLFLSMYILALFGNLLIILTVSSDSRLHTPMYFFLSNLSIVDIAFISTTVPRVIVDIQTHCPVISYVSCLTQMSLFLIFGSMDNMLLAVMAYDRFVAICHPLYYQIIMNPSRCGVLVLGSFLFSLLELQLHYLAVLNFFDCENFIEVSNFFCGPSEVLELVHFDTVTDTIVRLSIGTIFALLPISGIIFSYFKIISSIIRSPSSSGKHKTFSTCGSHLSIVGLFYGTGLGVYLSSSLSHSPRSNAVASVMYTVVTPMLNPFIYSLRNKDIKSALRKILSSAF